jgi:hypothetical protein
LIWGHTRGSEYNLAKSASAFTGTMSYPLPEKVNLAVEVKSDKSGTIVLAKDRFALVGCRLSYILLFAHRVPVGPSQGW